MPKSELIEFDDDTQRRKVAREQVNIVTDTVTGLNLRKSDNVIQGLSVAIGLGLGAVIGALYVTQERVLGGLVGGFLGVVVGLFGSGVFLMIYRLVRHLRGRHD